MRLPKLTVNMDLSQFTGREVTEPRFTASQIGVEAQHAFRHKAPKAAAGRAMGVEKSYSGQCCRRDPQSGKFLDCCYGQCRVVDSC